MSDESTRYRNEQRRGFRIHRLVYLCVIPLLAIINLTFVPEFLWFLFPTIGWGIGLTMHYVFGVRRLKESMVTEPYSEQLNRNQRR